MTDGSENEVPLPADMSELITAQRKFLHDVASPLMIALGMTDTAISQLDDGENEKLRSRLEKSKTALTRISQMLKSNRAMLHALGDVHGKE